MTTLTVEKFSTNYILNYIVLGSGYFGCVIFLICNIFIKKFKIIIKIKQKHKREESCSIELIGLQGMRGRQEAAKLSDFYPEQLSGRW